MPCATARLRRVVHGCNVGPAGGGSAPMPDLRNSKAVRSRDGNQGGEMAVSVPEFKGLDPTRSGVDSIADRPATGAGENELAVLLPRFVQRLEPRRREGVPGLVEPLVEVVAS